MKNNEQFFPKNKPPQNTPSLQAATVKNTFKSINNGNNLRASGNPLQKKNILLLSLLLTVASFFVYANTLKNGYAMDDVEVLQQNSFVNKGFAGIPELLSTPHLFGFMIAPNETYRPLSLVMFAVEFQFWGANPVVGHFFNVLLYAACACLLFLFLSRVFDGRKNAVSFVAALLFVMHPIHTEVVANIKSRDELLCFFFAFLSLNLFLTYLKNSKRSMLVSGIFAMFLSLLSKESVVTFIGVIPLLFFFYKNADRKKSTMVFAGTCIAVIAFLGVRAIVLSSNHNVTVPVNMMDNALAGAPGIATRLATSILVLGNYLKLLLVPYPLSIDYSFNSIPFVGFGDFRVIISLLVYVCLLGVGIYRLFKNAKDPWALAILFYLVTLSLFSNVFFLIGSGMSERFLFFPSVGFCLVLALAIEKWIVQMEHMTLPALKSRNIILVLLPLLVLYSSITIGRNEEWVDSETLFESDLKKVPDNSRLNYCVGFAYVTGKYQAASDPAEKKAILEKGIGYLRKSVAICPSYCNAQTELGDAYFINKQYDSAEVHDRLALAINPKASEVMNNLAGVYFVTHQYAKALALCRQAVVIRPRYAQAYYNIGLCLNNLKQFDSSVVYLKKALELDPGFRQSDEMLAKDYKALKLEDSSKKYEALNSIKRPQQ